MATEVRPESGKSAFVRETLGKNPKANPKLVNVAWKAAGNRDPISSSLVHKVRSTMGLTGNLRAKSGAAKPAAAEPKRRGRPPKSSVSAATAPKASASVSARKVQPSGTGGRVLEQLESEVDQLIFKLMGVGGLPDVEDALRKARRLLVLAQRD
jgi:hypothetical protein